MKRSGRPSGPPRPVQVGDGQPHGTPRIRHSGRRGTIFEQPGQTIAPLVAEKGVGGDVVVDVEIQPAVAVQVAGGDRQAPPPGIAHAGGQGHLLEGPVPPVAEQSVGLGVEGVGVQGERHFGPTACAVAGGGDHGLGRAVVEGQVVGDVEVQVAVPVQIAPGGAGGPQGVVHPGGGRHLVEGAVPPIAEQPVGTVIRDVEIQVAVVVVVGEEGPHAEAGLVGDACGRGDFVEGAVAPVEIETIRGDEIHGVEIRITVSVDVAPGQTGTRVLGQQAVAGPRSVGRDQARFGGDVEEGQRGCLRGCPVPELATHGRGAIGQVGVTARSGPRRQGHHQGDTADGGDHGHRDSRGAFQPRHGQPPAAVGRTARSSTTVASLVALTTFGWNTPRRSSMPGSTRSRNSWRYRR